LVVVHLVLPSQRVLERRYPDFEFVKGIQIRKLVADDADDFEGRSAHDDLLAVVEWLARPQALPRGAVDYRDLGRARIVVARFDETPAQQRVRAYYVAEAARRPGDVHQVRLGARVDRLAPPRHDRRERFEGVGLVDYL